MMTRTDNTDSVESLHKVRYQVLVPEAEWKINVENKHASSDVEKNAFPKDTEASFSLKPKS